MKDSKGGTQWEPLVTIVTLVVVYKKLVDDTHPITLSIFLSKFSIKDIPYLKLDQTSLL